MPKLFSIESRENPPGGGAASFLSSFVSGDGVAVRSKSSKSPTITALFIAEGGLGD